MERHDLRMDMARAYSRIGYGRLNKETDLSEKINQTGYGTAVSLPFEETIVKDGDNIPNSVEKEMQDLGHPEAYSDRSNDFANRAQQINEQEAKFLGTKTKSEVDKARRYELQESKRAPKVQVDQKVILLSWIIAVGVAFISSAIVSFNGITAVAAFVGLSGSWMSGLFFFFIELMYLVFLVAYLVLASRVDDEGIPEKTRGAMLGMIAFGGIAVLANGFHTLDFWAWDITNPQVWAGLVLSMAAPIAIISASKMASRVVFARAIKL